MRVTHLSFGLTAALVAARGVVERAASKTVLSHYMLGDITEEHAHKDIDDAIAMGLDGFVLNVGYPKLDWVSTTLSHLYGYADYLAGQGSNFRLVLSLDLYATGAWCYDHSLGDDCGGPKEYTDILKAFLGRDSYFRYGPNNFPFITSFSTGNQTDKQFAAWKEEFANQMYFMPGIDDTPGFWESHPAWWDYWGKLIDGASAWESAWPEVHGTNEGDMSRDIKVMGPLKEKGKGYMIAISMLQYKNAYGANLYRRGEMNMIKRMQNILTMDPQPDIVQLLTWNDGPESHHFGNLWPEQNKDRQPNQYASPEGSDHTALQSLYSAFIQAWKSGGAMVPAGLSKRADALPEGALWHKTIFQDTTCPGGDSEVKYFQAPNGTDAGLDALHWSLAVPANAAGWTVDVMSNGKSISSKVLQAGLNYGTVEDGIQEGTQRLIIKNGGQIVAGTDSGRCLSKSCHDGIYNFNPQVMAVKGDYDDGDCWQVGGEAVLDYANGVVYGTTLGRRAVDDDGPLHELFTPFHGYDGCKEEEADAIAQAWEDVYTIVKDIKFNPNGLLEQRNFGSDIGERPDDGRFITMAYARVKALETAMRRDDKIRISCKDIDDHTPDVKPVNCSSIINDKDVGGYAFDDGYSQGGGTIVLCPIFFLPGQENLDSVRHQLEIDKTQRKQSIYMNGRFRMLLHEMAHLPSISGTTSKVVLDRLAADVGRAQAYMPRFVEMMAYNFPKKTHLNADSYAWFAVERFFENLYGTPNAAWKPPRDDGGDDTTTTTEPAPQPTEYPTTYDCDGSKPMCGSFEVKYCDHAVNSLIRNDDKNYGYGKGINGNCWGDVAGYGCVVFVTGDGCVASGNEMWWMYQDLRDSDKGGCDKCGSVHYGNGCRFTVNYKSGCDNR